MSKAAQLEHEALSPGCAARTRSSSQLLPRERGQWWLLSNWVAARTACPLPESTACTSHTAPVRRKLWLWAWLWALLCYSSGGTSLPASAVVLTSRQLRKQDGVTNNDVANKTHSRKVKVPLEKHKSGTKPSSCPRQKLSAQPASLRQQAGPLAAMHTGLGIRERQVMWWQHPDSMEGEDSGPCRALRLVCWAWTLVWEPGRESSIQEKRWTWKPMAGTEVTAKGVVAIQGGFTTVAGGLGGRTGAGLQSLARDAMYIFLLGSLSYFCSNGEKAQVCERPHPRPE